MDFEDISLDSFFIRRWVSDHDETFFDLEVYSNQIFDFDLMLVILSHVVQFNWSSSELHQFKFLRNNLLNGDLVEVVVFHQDNVN